MTLIGKKRLLEFEPDSIPGGQWTERSLYEQGGGLRINGPQG
jgi:hypothetical protein